MTADDLPLVSIVTVVRNDPVGLEKTIDSVISQDYRRIEYVVVDGASTDGTLEVLKRRQASVNAWISEPDGGIYQAMNKGVSLASGEYVCFMNAGDTFANSDTVSRMFHPYPEVELLWGDCIVEKQRSEEYDCARNVVPRLHRQMTVSHQSLFTRRAILLKRPYDESFRIAADYDFLCERLLAGAPWEYRPIPVSRINDTGASARIYRTSIQEKRQIALTRFPGKRLSILAWYLLLTIYMNMKTSRPLEPIKGLLRPSYHFARDKGDEIRFWLKRKLCKARRRRTSFPVKGAFCILCVKRPAYALLAVANVNSLHYLYSGYRVHIMTDDAGAAAVNKLISRLDYPGMVEVINRFGSSSEPWQFQKVRCLMEASRNGWILVDADTVWHHEPGVDPRKVTLLVKAYDFGKNEAEKEFLSKNDMKRALGWPHLVTGFVSLPPAFYSDELASLTMEWTKKAFADGKLKRISEEIGVNLAVQSLIPRDRIATLKQADGPNDKNIMQSLYYGCVNEIDE